MPSAPPIVPRLKPGQFGWKVMVDPRSRHRRSGNASTAASVGSKSDVIAARPKPASHSIASAGRRTHPYGSLRLHLKCRSCRKGRYAPPVHMVRLTEDRETAPYVWVHPASPAEA